MQHDAITTVAVPAEQIACAMLCAFMAGFAQGQMMAAHQPAPYQASEASARAMRAAARRDDLPVLGKKK